MRVHLRTLGCRLNEAEIESWSRGFRSQGHEVTDDPGQADLVVINTCAVTGEAVRKSRKLLHRLHRANPSAKLVVSGCFASLAPRETARTLGVDLVIGNLEKDRLVEITSRELDLHAMPEQATTPGESPLLREGRQRAFVKVQDGCRYQCTFCVVTLARGEERSRPIPAVVAEINRLYDEGIREVALTGVHIGGYGSDCGSSLAELVAAVLRETDIPRLRLGAVEPWDLPAPFWDLFENPRFLPHLHLPLQSGADTVLRRMARRCKRDEFLALAEMARQRVPDFNLTTDIIVGFPGESDREWRQTMELVEQIGFGHLHIFAYSPRPGTRAATLPGAVPRSLIRARSQALHELGRRLKRETLARFRGRCFPVLVEQYQEATGTWGGYTPNFLRVAFPGQWEQALENRILDLEMTGVDAGGEHLLARPVA